MFDSLAITVLVGGAAFGVAFLLWSLAKFDFLAHTAERAPSKFKPRDAFLWRIAGRMAEKRRTTFAVLLIEADGGAGGALADRLSGAIRAADSLMPLDGGRIGLIMTMAPEHLGRVADRLQTRLGGAAARAAAVMVERQTSASAVLAALEQDLDATRTPGAPAWAMPAYPPAPVDTSDLPLRDPVSGLLAPQHIPPYLRRHIERLLYRKRPVIVMQVGVDGYKELFEGRGRASTDAVLREAGRILNVGLRERDFVARMSDESFLVVLDANPPYVPAIMERLLRTAAATAPTAERPAFAFSIGVTLLGGQTSTPSRALIEAHDALLEARRCGGNQWKLYDVAMSMHRERTTGNIRSRGYNEARF